MSYFTSISPIEISISSAALQKLRHDHGVQERDIDGLVNALSESYNIDALVEGYSDQGEPLMIFELRNFSSSEREGLQGAVEKLKLSLPLVDAQSFELTDEYGRTTTYDHPGFD